MADLDRHPESHQRTPRAAWPDTGAVWAESGVTFSSVNHWENGKRTPQPFLVRRLVEMKEELDAEKKAIAE